MDKFMILDLVTSILGLSCVLLAARKSKYNFWIGYLYNITLFIMFWNRSLYASLMLQPVSLFINIIGITAGPIPSREKRAPRTARH